MSRVCIDAHLSEYGTEGVHGVGGALRPLFGGRESRDSGTGIRQNCGNGDALSRLPCACDPTNVNDELGRWRAAQFCM